MAEISRIRNRLRAGTPRRVEASFARGVTLAIVAPVIVIVALSLPARGIGATSCPTSPRVDLPPDPGWSVVMSRAQKIRAAVLAQCDPRIRAALHGEGTTVDEIGPWSREGTTESLIGADVTLKLDRPTTLEADWTFVKFAADGSYRQGTPFHYRAERVTELEVYIDLGKDEVVAFAPLDGDAVESTVYPVRASDQSGSGDRPIWEVALLASGSVVALLLVAWFTRRVAVSRGIS